MNRKEIAELMPIIQAFLEGRTIECRTKSWELNKGWRYETDWKETQQLVFRDTFEYRIKPEFKYRPFKDAKECWTEMQKHQPFGWVKDRNGSAFVIENLDSRSFVDVYGEGTCDFKEVFENHTFADGTPFGIKVEE